MEVGRQVEVGSLGDNECRGPPIPLNTEGLGSVLGEAPSSYSPIPQKWVSNTKSQFYRHPNISIQEM